MTNACSSYYEAASALPAGVLQAMLQAVERKYGRLISDARKEWERRFAASDPSDACVTVRINGKDSREFARLFPLEYFGQAKVFVAN